LSLISWLLATSSRWTAIWFAGQSEKYENALCLSFLFIPRRNRAPRFTSTRFIFLYAFHELALIPTFLLIGIWEAKSSRGTWKITTISRPAVSFLLLV